MTSERKFIAENIKRVLLKEYLKKKVERAGFGGIDIQRTPMGTRVSLIAERPGMIIGRKGGAIKDLTEIVQKDFEFDNPQIEVQEEKEPNLNPHIMAHKLAAALERGWHFRRAGHSTVRRIMSAGAKGCQVIISGKLIGQRHRVEKFKEGHIKYCGEPARIWMKEGFAIAKKKTGIIGIKVQIMDPNAKLPDEIEIQAPVTVKDLTGGGIPEKGVKEKAGEQPLSTTTPAKPSAEVTIESDKKATATKKEASAEKAPATKAEDKKSKAKSKSSKVKEPETGAEKKAEEEPAKDKKPTKEEKPQDETPPNSKSNTIKEVDNKDKNQEEEKAK